MLATARKRAKLRAITAKNHGFYENAYGSCASPRRLFKCMGHTLEVHVVHMGSATHLALKRTEPLSHALVILVFMQITQFLPSFMFI